MRQPGLKYATKPRRANPEAAIQRAVVEHFRFRATPGTLVMAIKNEGKRSSALGLEYKRQGMRPGAPDLLVLVRGTVPLGLELKTKTGKTSAEQRKFADDWREAGAVYVCVYGLNDAIQFLENWGALKPAKRASA